MATDPYAAPRARVADRPDAGAEGAFVPEGQAVAAGNGVGVDRRRLGALPPSARGVGAGQRWFSWRSRSRLRSSRSSATSPAMSWPGLRWRPDARLPRLARGGELRLGHSSTGSRPSRPARDPRASPGCVDGPRRLRRRVRGGGRRVRHRLAIRALAATSRCPPACHDDDPARGPGRARAHRAGGDGDLVRARRSSCSTTSASATRSGRASGHASRISSRSSCMARSSSGSPSSPPFRSRSGGSRSRRRPSLRCTPRTATSSTTSERPRRREDREPGNARRARSAARGDRRTAAPGAASPLIRHARHRPPDRDARRNRARAAARRPGAAGRRLGASTSCCGSPSSSWPE